MRIVDGPEVSSERLHCRNPVSGRGFWSPRSMSALPKSALCRFRCKSPLPVVTLTPAGASDVDHLPPWRLRLIVNYIHAHLSGLNGFIRFVPQDSD